MGPVEFTFQDQISPLGEEIRNLAFGAGVFVITTASSTVLYSSDGLTWNVASGVTGSISLNRLVWSGDAFYISSYDDPNYKIFRSTDGINWTNTYSSSSTSRTLNIAANGYAYGGSYRTNNGATFESSDVGGGSSLAESIAFGNGVYVSSSGGLYYRSTNGTSFSQIAGLSNNGFGSEPVVWSSVREQFVAWLSSPDEFSERGVYVSSDGITWTRMPHTPEEYTNSRGMTTAAYGNGLALIGAPDTEGSVGMVYLADNEDISYEANEIDNPFSGVSLNPRFLAFNGEFFLAANFLYNDGSGGFSMPTPNDVIRINASAGPPPGPEEVVCFWTGFNKSYEICEGRGGGGSFTPEWAPQSDWPAIDDPGDNLRINDTLDEIYGNPISEPDQYGYNYFAGDGFGDPETILFIAKIPGIGDATGVTWAYNKVSGFDRSFQVNQIIGEYVLFDIQFNFGVDGFNAEHASVYEFVGTADGTELPAITLDFVVFSGLF